MYHHAPQWWKRGPLGLLAVFCLASPAFAIWPFPPKRFTGNSLMDAGSRGLHDVGRVVAFGDFNGDQFLDVLSLGEDQQTLSVYHWNHDDYRFVESVSFHHPHRVVNVVPSDFTHNGKLDLLVMSQSQTRDQLDIILYPAIPEGGFDFNRPLSIPSSTLSQPIPIDLDGDMKIDLLGITPSSKDSRSPLQLWRNTWNSSEPQSTLFEIVNPKFNGAQCSISDPHSNAIVDLNGDCLADLFLVCDDGNGGKFYQIWVNNKSDGFSLSQEGSLPSGTQAISFADIDRDGTIDMVFPTCSHVSSAGIGSDCYLNIAYNQQLPLCTSTVPGVNTGAQTCRPPEDLCTADPNFKFDLNESHDNVAFTRFPIATLFPGLQTPSLVVLDTSYSPPLPQPIKLGDVNLDGFPDIVMIIASGTDRIPHLVFSEPCSKDIIGCPSYKTRKRGWKVVKKGVESLEAVKDARVVSFLDMDEDGTLDFMIQRTGEDGLGKVLFVQNNFYYDAFFLKAIVLNGACENGWCYSPNGTRYHPFGVSHPGASYKYTVLDTSGHRSAAQVGQLAQTSYHALQTPYSFFGLGRTNNYIENLFVGSTMHTKQHYIAMEGVIPNSRVVILPSPNDEAWKRQLFLRPGEWIPWVTLTVVVGTILLAVIVFVLHLNEKREDELERRRASHHINFDAL